MPYTHIPNCIHKYTISLCDSFTCSYRAPPTTATTKLIHIKWAHSTPAASFLSFQEGRIFGPLTRMAYKALERQASPVSAMPGAQKCLMKGQRLFQTKFNSRQIKIHTEIQIVFAIYFRREVPSTDLFLPGVLYSDEETVPRFV